MTSQNRNEASEDSPIKNVLDAYLEAAHAIMAVRLNQRFEYVMLCNIRDGSRIVTGRVVFPKEPDGLGQWIYVEDAYLEALVSLAGAVANKIMCPRCTYRAIYADAALEDYANARNMVALHIFNQPMYQRLSTMDQAQCDSYIAKVLLPHTRQLVKSSWASVGRVGNLLLQKEKLDYDEVVGIARMGTSRPIATGN